MNESDEFRSFATFLAVVGVFACVALMAVIVVAPAWFHSVAWGVLR